MNTRHPHQPQPYPLYVLPSSVQGFVRQVCAATQASTGLVAPAVLSAMAAAVQGVADVKSANGLAMPTSLFFGVAVPSGERKSSVLQHVTSAFEEFELSISDTSVAHPILLEQTTEQGLIDLFQQGARSIFFSLSEGSQMLKSLDYSAFCKRYDGATIRHTTRKNGTVILPHTRGSVCMLIQDTTFSRYMSKKGELLIESGFMPRILMSFPSSTAPSIASRGRDDAEYGNPATHPFHERVKSLLNDYADALARAETDRKLLTLEPEAFHTWADFYRYTQSLLVQSGSHSWTGLDPFIKRTGEHALRLAAVLQWFDTPRTEIENWAITAAIEIVLWHLNEAKLAFGEPPLEIQMQEWADALHAYLLRQHQAVGSSAAFTRSELLRCVPTSIRKADRLNAAIYWLSSNHRVLTWKQGRKELISLNLLPPTFNMRPISNATPLR